MKRLNISVIFGSKSDERVSSELVAKLEELENVQVDFQVISAHRNAKQLAEYIESCLADCFIAGAGLAAHLPGVVSSLTDKPVMGMPVDSCFSGLDSFLSIVQMPKGVPVQSYYPEDLTSLVLDLKNMHHSLNSDLPLELFVSHPHDSYEYVSQGIDIVQNYAKEHLGKEFKLIHSESELNSNFGIHFVTSDDFKPVPGFIQVPVYEKARLRDVNVALDFFRQAHKGGSWVGVNRFENATIMIAKWIKALKG